MNPDLPAVVRGSTSFALDLFAALRPGHAGNLFFSPGSLATALAMTEGGQPGYRLHVANRLWGQAGYPFRREFLRLTREH
jgi:serine protease inhibitor